MSYTITPWTQLQKVKKSCRMNARGLAPGVCILNDHRQRVWRQPGNIERPQYCVPHVQQGGGGVKFWYGITWGHRTLFVIVEGNLPALRYREEILQQIVGQYRQHFDDSFILMEDNSLVHSAVLVNAFLQRARITRTEWLAYSPIMNPIKHVWDQLK